MASEKMFDIETLPYRQSTAAIVENSDGEFLLVQKKNYQSSERDIPGGGIEEGETAREAVLRELLEETGSTEYEIVQESKKDDIYEWPQDVIRRKFNEKGHTWRGQQRKQFYVRYTGSEKNLKPQDDELKLVEWVSPNELAERLVFPNQLENVRQLFSEFGLSNI